MENKQSCYVNAPWNLKNGIDFNKIYSDNIKPIVVKAGLSCWRGDDPLPNHNMQEAILTAAINHDVMIADLTIGSPNVTYEIGIRHSLGKGNTILLCADRLSALPIHFKNLPIIEYRLTHGALLPNDAEKLATALYDRLLKLGDGSPGNPVKRVTGSLVKFVEERRLKEIGTRIFIGHGRSKLWLELKNFIQDQLKLPWDEFNRIPIAGITNTERLLMMLNDSAFAFLIMTAEDEQQDGKVHARMNVVHEIGLFQGRLNFSRAIILLEEGCEGFSNSDGLGHIRFPKGNISAIFENIRQVLEREELI